MPYIEVWVDDLPIEEIDDEKIEQEYLRRFPDGPGIASDDMNRLLERLYLFRSRSDCPEELREIIWQRIGRTL